MTGPPLKKAYEKAIAEDQSLQRGHMNPSAINSFSVQFMKATFTLTNAAPIFRATDSKLWNKYEVRIRMYAQNICGENRRGDLYLLTGTSHYGIKKDDLGGILQDTSKNPDFDEPKEYLISDGKVKVQLQIPRAIWTAGCCIWKELDQETGNMVDKAESFGVMGNNQRDELKVFVTKMNLSKLELLLTKTGGEKVELFPGKPVCSQPLTPCF